MPSDDPRIGNSTTPAFSRPELDRLAASDAAQQTLDELKAAGFKPLSERRAGALKLTLFHIANAFGGFVGSSGRDYASNSQLMGSQKADLGWRDRIRQDWGQTYLNATLESGPKPLRRAAEFMSHVPALLSLNPGSIGRSLAAIRDLGAQDRQLAASFTAKIPRASFGRPIDKSVTSGLSIKKLRDIAGSANTATLRAAKAVELEVRRRDAAAIAMLKNPERFRAEVYAPAPQPPSDEPDLLAVEAKAAALRQEDIDDVATRSRLATQPNGTKQVFDHMAAKYGFHMAERVLEKFVLSLTFRWDRPLSASTLAKMERFLASNPDALNARDETRKAEKWSELRRNALGQRQADDIIIHSIATQFGPGAAKNVVRQFVGTKAITEDVLSRIEAYLTTLRDSDTGKSAPPSLQTRRELAQARRAKSRETTVTRTRQKQLTKALQLHHPNLNPRLREKRQKMVDKVAWKPAPTIKEEPDQQIGASNTAADDDQEDPA